MYPSELRTISTDCHLSDIQATNQVEYDILDIRRSLGQQVISVFRFKRFSVGKIGNDFFWSYRDHIPAFVLSRLKSLYLYNDEAISERDYLLEKKSLEDAIKKIDRRLEEIERSSSKHFSLTDDEFMAKASIFIMTHQLQNKRFIKFDKLIKKIDPQIVKEFVNSVVQKIVIKNGRVTSIRFKNGLEHKFLYKTLE